KGSGDGAEADVLLGAEAGAVETQIAGRVDSADAGGVFHRVDGGDHIGDGRAAGKGELLHAKISRDLNGDGVGGRERAAGVADGGGLSALGNGDHHIHRGVIGQERRVDVHVGEIRRVHATGGVIQRAVEQLHAVELCRVGAAIDAGKDRIHL